MRKIRELGSLPSDAFDKYQGLTLGQVQWIIVQHNTIMAPVKLNLNVLSAVMSVCI